MSGRRDKVLVVFVYLERGGTGYDSFASFIVISCKLAGCSDVERLWWDNGYGFDSEYTCCGGADDSSRDTYNRCECCCCQNCYSDY